MGNGWSSWQNRFCKGTTTLRKKREPSTLFCREPVFFIIMFGKKSSIMGGTKMELHRVTDN